MANLYQKLHPPTPASRAQAETEKEQIKVSPLRDSFYLEMKLGPMPQIPWSFNTEEMLGCKQLTMESFKDRLHPAYVGLFLDFAVGVYTLVPKYKAIIQEHPMAYNIMVPLLNKDGKYLWFNQFSKPSGFAENGQLTHHLNAYRLVGEFQGNMLLLSPYVIFKVDTVPGVQQELQQLVAKAMIGQMFELELENEPRFNGTHKRILFAWWKSYAKLGANQANHKTVAGQLKLKVGTTRKHAQTILEAARIVFPMYPMRSMNDLAQLLVSLFGAEGYQFPQQGSAPSN